MTGHRARTSSFDVRSWARSRQWAEVRSRIGPPLSDAGEGATHNRGVAEPRTPPAPERDALNKHQQQEIAQLRDALTRAEFPLRSGAQLSLFSGVRRRSSCAELGPLSRSRPGLTQAVVAQSSLSSARLRERFTQVV
jgi:hypothetical protein